MSYEFECLLCGHLARAFRRQIYLHCAGLAEISKMSKVALLQGERPTQYHVEFD